MKRWSVHCCALHHHCRRWADGPWRVEIGTPWFHWGVALRPQDRYVGTAYDYRLYWTSFRRKT